MDEKQRNTAPQYKPFHTNSSLKVIVNLFLPLEIATKTLYTQVSTHQHVNPSNNQFTPRYLFHPPKHSSSSAKTARQQQQQQHLTAEYLNSTKWRRRRQQQPKAFPCNGHQVNTKTHPKKDANFLPRSRPLQNKVTPKAPTVSRIPRLISQIASICHIKPSKLTFI